MARQHLSIPQLQILSQLLKDHPDPKYLNEIVSVFGANGGIRYHTIRVLRDRGWVDTWRDTTEGPKGEPRKVRMLALTPEGVAAASDILAPYQLYP